MKHRKTILMPTRSVAVENSKSPVAANEARPKGALDSWNDKVLTILRKPASREVYWIAAAKGARKPEFTDLSPRGNPAASSLYVADGWRSRVRTINERTAS
jgi:hypothetical protein